MPKKIIYAEDAIDALADYIHNVNKVMGNGKLSAWDCADAAWSVLGDLPSAQPEIVRCKDCKYIEAHHYEENGEPPYIKYTCAYKAGLAKGYQVHECDFCSRAERREK